jgi:hypothetical protein
MQDLITAVARLVREMPRNPTVIEVDQALTAALATRSNALDKSNKPRFDKQAYQRELMKKRRAAEKVAKKPLPLPT